MTGDRLGELDAYIAEHVMALRVVGIGPVGMDPDGDERVSPVVGTSEERPVHEPGECRCHGMTEPSWSPRHEPINGHYPWNLLPVPRYSSDPAACALLKAWLRGKGIEWMIHDHFAVKKGHRWVNIKQTMAPQGGSNGGGKRRTGREKFEGVVRGAPTEEEAVARFARALKESGAL